ncbi:concanavalin A-like lectin/glucanase domain-containing protein [Epithele typhae]|uniref:concanavalin A-like lectin/glucanase domain-containing protein n=1 Tax=Epithele typhae TaxID=378194 RepID=UPI0020072B7E|nr:concanavalin A-like lectin/glucanase domain-containing protein [Epithele typhae]KAH9920835.1 concanavalin A-like lectin/glucanase domain-containing protein [Epithele typhae]
MRLSSDLRLTSAALLVASSQALAASFSLLHDYSGANFFDGWDFKDGFDDTTNGDVNYLGQSQASSSGLAVIQNNQAILKVDNSTFVPFNQKRNSVFLTTHEFFQLGSVFVFDAAHIPAGCSVWPSFWTRGPNWPSGGEIDVLENVNLATNNQMTLHTNPGCTQASGVTQLGKTSGSDCSLGANSSQGCTVVESQSNSFGSGFNTAGGGVWATQFDDSGIFVWFWTRDAVPSTVSSATDSIDPSTFGTPSAAWPSSSCNISQFFTPQQLVLDITLCGDFAGTPSVYTQTCGSPGEQANTSSCYVENVINNGSAADSFYAEAYFAINYVKVFSSGAAPLDPVVSGSSTLGLTSITDSFATGTGTAASGATSGSTKAAGSGGSGAVPLLAPGGWGAAIAAVVGALGVAALLGPL